MNSDWDISATLFLHLALLSMMAIGGGVLALAPDILRFVSDTNHWVSRETFVESFTLAQIAPGPNFLFATLLGLKIAGLPGAAAATLALVLPPATLAILSLHFGSKIRWGGFGMALRRALQPLSIGMVSASAWSLGTITVHTAAQGGVFLAALVLLVRTRVNPLWLIAAGAGAGMAGWI